MASALVLAHFQDRINKASSEQIDGFIANSLDFKKYLVSLFLNSPENGLNEKGIVNEFETHLPSNDPKCVYPFYSNIIENDEETKEETQSTSILERMSTDVYRHMNGYLGEREIDQVYLFPGISIHAKW